MSQDVNQALQTLFLRRAVLRTRYENETLQALRAEWAAILPGAIAAVHALNLPTGAPARSLLGARGVPVRMDTAQQIQGALNQIAALWRGAMARAAARVAADLRAVAELDALEVPRGVQAVLDRGTGRTVQEAAGDPTPARLLFSRVPVGQIAQLVLTPLAGANAAQAFQDLTLRVLMRIRNLLQAGLQRGDAVGTVARALRGMLGNTRWEAERIVRSEYVRVAGQAAVEQFDQNRDLLRGVRWVATLDRRTCVQCGMLDGRLWPDARRAPVPVVSTHPNCRCVLVPVVRPARGLDLPPSARSAFTGQVPGTTTYPTWFGQQEPAFQQAVLGPTRYRLYRSRRLNLGDFVTAAGVRSVRDAVALARRREAE